MRDLPGPDQVLAFWFSEAAKPHWFEADLNFDAAAAQMFGNLLPAAAAGELDDWTKTVSGALALVLTLDQAPRNLFRNDARAFSTDRQALGVTAEALARGFDAELTPEQRVFLYLPLMHCENLEEQERCVSLMQERVGQPDPILHARQHRDIIARFGRFPHRNEALGRASTPEEIRFLVEESPYRLSARSTAEP